MDKAQAAFEILYTLSAIDGTVDDGEIRLIGTTLAETYSRFQFEPMVILKKLRDLSEADRLQRFHASVDAFAKETNFSERRQLFGIINQLAGIDGDSSPEERVLVGYIKSSWGIELEDMRGLF